MRWSKTWPIVRCVIYIMLIGGQVRVVVSKELTLHRISIPAEGIAQAIREFIKQTGVLIVADGGALDGKRSGAVEGVITVDEGLRRLLSGSGLTFTHISDTTVSIKLVTDTLPANARRAIQPAVVATPVSSGSSLVGEVVVNAQRREELLQEVPISVLVVNNQQLVVHHLESLEDLAQAEPSLHIGENGRSNELYIRGIGSGVNSFFDQSVGVFVDDLYHGRSRFTTATFLDLDRIEILRGPQTTFFGNNAIAGSLNIITRKPSDETEGDMRALYGQFGQYLAEVDAGAPIIEGRLAARAAVLFDGEEGWLRNINANERTPTSNDGAGRLTLLATPKENLDIFLKSEVSRNGNRGAFPAQITGCPPPAPFITAGFCKIALSTSAPIGLNNNLIASATNQRITLNSVEEELTLNYHRWGHTLTSVTGYFNSNYSINLDAGQVDPGNAALFHAQIPEHYHQVSQEVRVASLSGRAVEYLAGAYFQAGRLDTTTASDFFFLTPAVLANAKLAPVLGPFLPLGQELRALQDERSYSFFCSLKWTIASNLKFAPGVRLSWVNRDFRESLLYGTATRPYGGVVPIPASLQPLGGVLGLGTPNSARLSRQDRAVQPSASLQYQFAWSAMGYLSYSRGFKAGGFNGADTSGNPANLPYGPEHVNAYELGLKSAWLGDRLMLNFDVFREDYHDLQVAALRQLDTGTFENVVDNAASSRSQGIELETEWAVTRDLRVAVHAAYLDARYLSYPNAAPSALQQLEGLKVQNLADRPTEFAPRASGSVTVTYSPALPGGYHLTMEITDLFSASYFLSGVDDDLVRQGSYSRLDARASLGTPDNAWHVDVIVKNLTDKHIADFATPMATSLGSTVESLEQPFNVALQVRFSW